MISPDKRERADVPAGAESPLNFAVMQRDLETLTMVQEAIMHRQTLLAFQPVMLGAHPDKIGFHEGLIRVLDPTGRVIPASDFMRLIEDNETGREMDVLALRHGLRALKANPGLRLSINMSARSIGYKPWTSTLNHYLNETPTLGERLILEISEGSAMLVPELVVDFMNRLQPRGICFALDNFGAGRTALKYFKDFDFDILKIDGQFIRNIAQSPDNRALTRALVGIARHFDMLTVAESVETQADTEVLIQMGVDCLQGYYFAAPTTRPAWLHQENLRNNG